MEILGIKQSSFEAFSNTSEEQRKGYLWFVRDIESGVTKSVSIYFGNRKYADVTSDSIITKLNNAIVSLGSAIDNDGTWDGFGDFETNPILTSATTISDALALLEYAIIENEGVVVNSIIDLEEDIRTLSGIVEDINVEMDTDTFSGTTLFPLVGYYYTASEAIDSLDITLPAIDDTATTKSIMINLTTGSSPLVTYTSEDDKPIAKFASSGKKTRKKDLAKIAMSYPHVYVGTVSVGANPMHTLKTIMEAEKYDGPSIIIAYAPCIAHGIKTGMQDTNKEQKLATQSGYFPLFRFNPETNKFTVDSGAEFEKLDELFNRENRYRSNKELLEKNKQEIKEYYESLKELEK